MRIHHTHVGKPITKIPLWQLRELNMRMLQDEIQNLSASDLREIVEGLHEGKIMPIHKYSRIALINELANWGCSGCGHIDSKLPEQLFVADNGRELVCKTHRS